MVVLAQDEMFVLKDLDNTSKVQLISLLPNWDSTKAIIG